MNLRILKKLSKRAAAYLPLLGDRRAQFPAEAGENYHGVRVRARKHYERCPSVHTDLFDEDEICTAPRCRRNHVWPYIKLRPPVHPLAGTIMVGAMSGYETPEWDEESAWGALADQVHWHFVQFNEDALVPTRRLRTPSEVFRAADDMVAERRAA
jgi:hypothetical protein